MSVTSEELPIINGKQVGSRYEWNVIKALEHYKVEYDIQVPFFGGRVRGGQVVDVIAYTVPLPTPIFVQSYWHTGAKEAESTLKVYAFEEATFGTYEKPVQLWKDDCETYDQALISVKKELRL